MPDIDTIRAYLYPAYDYMDEAGCYAPSAKTNEAHLFY